MFCKKCGKFIDYDSDVCNECHDNNVADTIPVVATTDEAPKKPEGRRTYGLGLAIAGAAIGLFSAIFSCIAYVFSLVVSVLKTEDYSQVGVTLADLDALGILSYVFAVFGIILAIPAIIFGAVSIKRFFVKKKLGEVKPIPTLIIGIVTVAETVSMVLLSIVSFLMIL